MRIDRRKLLKGGALAGVASALPAASAAAAAAAAGPALVVFDSRLAESVQFARALPGERVDVASDDGWARVRAAGSSRVEGLTRWSDWVAARGSLEEQGLRLASEMPAKAPLSGRTHLFRWSMATR